MAQHFLDEDENEFIERNKERFRSGGKKRRRSRKKIQFQIPHFSLPTGFAWYDYIMIPVCILGVIYVILNFAEVTFFFFKLTIWAIDISFVLLVIALILLLLSRLFRRRRYYW